MRTAPILLACVLAVLATASASAGPKDESAASWLPFIPPGFNDWRAALADKGFEFSATYVSDNIVNVTGGVKRGGIQFGRMDVEGDADLEKIAGWTGATAHANFFWIWGEGLTRNNVGNIATISEIEALPDTRLYEAWIEQTLGKVSIKVGQQAADVEFFDSETDDLFINGTFGWPAIKATNLPAGGPAPPIAVPGVRVKADLADQITAYAAVFNGNPAAPGPGDPQRRDDHGLAWRVNDDPWLIAQTKFGYDLHLGRDPLPGDITPGAWYHTGKFDDQRFSIDGRSLADPLSSGIPIQHRGNFGIFAVFEQMLVRPPTDIAKGVSANEKGVTVFARVAYSPEDRNLINFYADGGIGFNNMLSARPDDRFGVAVAYMHISPWARALDVDTQYFSGYPTPLRSAETLLEVIYEAHVLPGWLVQPFFQYVFRPQGGVSDPSDITGVTRVGDAAVFGLTTTLKY